MSYIFPAKGLGYSLACPTLLLLLLLGRLSIPLSDPSIPGLTLPTDCLHSWAESWLVPGKLLPFPAPISAGKRWERRERAGNQPT